MERIGRWKHFYCGFSGVHTSLACAILWDKLCHAPSAKSFCPWLVAAGVVVACNCNNDLYNLRPRCVEVSLHDKFEAPILRKIGFPDVIINN